MYLPLIPRIATYLSNTNWEADAPSQLLMIGRSNNFLLNLTSKLKNYNKGGAVVTSSSAVAVFMVSIFIGTHPVSGMFNQTS